MKNKFRNYRIYSYFIYFFLYAPIAVLIFFSFNQSKSRNLFTGFTLDWYAKLFQDDAILSALAVTLIVAAVSSLVATVIGTAASVGIAAMKRTPRAIIMNISYVPVINPEIVTGVSLMLLFVVIKGGLQYLGVSFSMGIGTLILAHITFNLPYVILSVAPKLRQLDKNMYEAGLDLGCNPWQAFFKVVLPQIMPGVLSGFLIALTFSIDDFVISYFNSGNAQTLPIAIFAMTRRKVSPEINALSTLLFLTVLSILLIMNYKDIMAEKRDKKEARR